MADPINSAQPHDESEELLPWYATGRLEAAQRERIEAHLARCEHCRQQLAVERRLIEQFRLFSPEVESGWTRIAGRVASDRRQSARRRRTMRELTHAIWPVFAQPAVAALATAQVAFLVVASGLLVWLSHPAYHALGSGSAPPSANIIIMFRANTPERDVRSVLGTASASIVGGPTSTGAYLIHVEPRRRQIALERLQADDHVQLAQPIDSAAGQ